MTTRLDLRVLVRTELLDIATPPLTPDALIHAALAAATATYSQHRPRELVTTATSTAGQTTLALPAGTLVVCAVLVDGVALPAAPDLAALRDTGPDPSYPLLFDVRPYAAPQAYALVAGVVELRYPLDAGRTVRLAVAASHMLPTDDTTPLTVPDADLDLLVLFAADRVARALRADLLKRGAVLTPGDNGYRERYEAALTSRRRYVVAKSLSR